MQLQLASRSEVGARSGNEDAVCHGTGSSGHFAVLADGAGGHSRGGEASARAIQTLKRVLGDTGVAFSPQSLTQMVRLAHVELLQHQGSDRPDARMHTTLVALWIEPSLKQALWTHVGDSRLYRVRQGQAELLTQDDSVVQHLVLSGVLTEAQSRNHPQKNHLLAALGMEGEVAPHTLASPVELREGDAFLLCSDGWWDGFETADIAASLARATSPEDWLADMQVQVAARAMPRQDNYSAIAVWLGAPAQALR